MRCIETLLFLHQYIEYMGLLVGCTNRCGFFKKNYKIFIDNIPNESPIYRFRYDREKYIVHIENMSTFVKLSLMKSIVSFMRLTKRFLFISHVFSNIFSVVFSAFLTVNSINGNIQWLNLELI